MTVGSETIRAAVWLLATLPLLVLLSNWVSMLIQRIFYRLTNGNQLLTIWLNQLIFFPGVLLHEMSHWTFAKFLGVPTGRMSLLPKSERNGMITLGFVEVGRANFIKEFLIGVAPLISGTAFILLLGAWRFQIFQVGSALLLRDFAGLRSLLAGITANGDVWMWLYLLFAVSNTMLPSASDRRPFPTVAGFLLIVGSVLYFSGFATVLWQVGENALLRFLTSMASAFTATILLDLLFLPLLASISFLVGSFARR